MKHNTPSLFALVLLALVSVSARASDDLSLFHQRVIILWDSQKTGHMAMDRQGFLNAMESFGLRPEKIAPAELDKIPLDSATLLVIPFGSGQMLSNQQVKGIRQAVERGMSLIFDGEGPLTKELGIKLSQPKPINELIFHGPRDRRTSWPPGEMGTLILAPVPIGSHPVYTTQEGETAVMAGSVGSGRYLFFGPLFDPEDGKGYTRFPSFPTMVMSYLRFHPWCTRNGVDVYLDLGDRMDDPDFSRLTRQWHESGIRSLYVSAWYHDMFPGLYEDLVTNAHANGLLVYAWFEWPHVSTLFWKTHPEWREKTAADKDANVDWRLLMNFQDRACLKAALKETNNVLMKYDWDGINIAEFYFESVEGPSSLDFTPLNAVARKEVRRRYGFDPLDLFKTESPHYWEKNESDLKKFYQYRTRLIHRLQKIFIDDIEAVGRKKKAFWKIVFTTTDVTVHPELGDYYAINLPDTVSLLGRQAGALQVEDEYYDWDLPPDRYLRMGESYQAIKSKIPFMIDMNIVDLPFAHRLPTAQPTGTELFQIYDHAAEQSSSVAIYSEFSVYEEDWKVMPFGMAHAARMTGEFPRYVIDTPYTVQLAVAPSLMTVDGQSPPCGDERHVIIPIGQHRIEISSSPDQSEISHPTLLCFLSGELEATETRPDGFSLIYSSFNRCLLRFTRAPSLCRIDGVRKDVPTNDDAALLIGPPGRHRVWIRY